MQLSKYGLVSFININWRIAYIHRKHTNLLSNFYTCIIYLYVKQFLGADSEKEDNSNNPDHSAYCNCRRRNLLF